jgi:hypothetical protein
MDNRQAMTHTPIQVYFLAPITGRRSEDDLSHSGNKLDSWTAFELQRETEKIQRIPHIKKNCVPVPSKEELLHGTETDLISRVRARTKSISRVKDDKKKESRRNQQSSSKTINWSRLLPTPNYDERERKLIEEAKKKRQNLLREVNDRKFTLGSRSPTTMHDSIASLSAIDKDDFSEMEDDEAEDGYHICCFF